MSGKKGMRINRPPRKLVDLNLVYDTPTDGEEPPKKFTEGQKMLWRVKKQNAEKFMTMWRQEEDRFHKRVEQRKAETPAIPLPSSPVPVPQAEEALGATSSRRSCRSSPPRS